MNRHILNSIVESEAIYLECLSVCLQYMKAMKVREKNTKKKGRSRITRKTRKI